MTKFVMETGDTAMTQESSLFEITSETLLITFFIIKGVVHFEFIPQDQTVNQILEWLHEAVYRKRPELWPSHWILHHDNAPAYKELSIKQFLTQKAITEMEHPPCSPDLAPNDFWPFPKIVCHKGMKIPGY
jgi:histone-lysine N-methyltransferase SETMAR